MAKNGFKVLDSDMHVFEPHDLYLKYMDPEWGDRIPRGEPRRRHGQIRFTFADGTPVRPGGSGLRSPRGAQEQRFEKVAPHYRNSLERDYDPVSQLDAMDVEGLDVAVLFRTFPLHCDDGLEGEYAMALCRAWNDWIFDFCKENPARMKFAALITLHDVDLAVEEARRAAEELGAAGLCLVPEPVNGNHIHDHCFDPLWAQAERSGVPICFHPAGFPRQEHAALRFVGHPNDGFLVSTYSKALELMMAIGSFCGGGVLERFPRLRAVFLEGNCSWLPWLLYRMDERWSDRKDQLDEPLSRPPSDYFMRQCFVSVDPDERLVTDVISRVGDGNLVISTDYPHDDAHWPHAMETFLGIDGVTDASRRKILWDNCARLYDVTGPEG
ncbi:MAG: amidohydrolase family protein [Deltaproteobacteria bacterium]|nr:amidohydrolase family protein [Deltaproteobacteria bacterium]